MLTRRTTAIGVSVLLATLAGCDGPVTPESPVAGRAEPAPALPVGPPPASPVVAPPPPRFDPEDAERTLRWLVAETTLVGNAAWGAIEERRENPLRKEKAKAYEAAWRRWWTLTRGLTGKAVAWPARVSSISEDRISVSGDLVEERRVRAFVVFDDPQPPPSHDSLLLGHAITADEASKLNREDHLLIRGEVTFAEIQLPGIEGDVLAFDWAALHVTARKVEALPRPDPSSRR